MAVFFYKKEEFIAENSFLAQVSFEIFSQVSSQLNFFRATKRNISSSNWAFEQVGFRVKDLLSNWAGMIFIQQALCSILLWAWDFEGIAVL